MYNGVYGEKNMCKLLKDTKILPDTYGDEFFFLI